MVLLNTLEVADILRIEVGTVRKLLHKGQLPGRKLGRDWRVDEGELQNYVRGTGKREFDVAGRDWGLHGERKPVKVRPVGPVVAGEKS
ncbi:MAG: helix-turn-helix domain-containing protein [Deltaproteobacteria bacterium]|nr:helix-turn-helix domain-containing protein [Deltaproteobacteria bacterium]